MIDCVILFHLQLGETETCPTGYCRRRKDAEMD